jgi:hypothetical protein
MIEQFGIAGLNSLQATPKRKKNAGSESKKKQCRCFTADADMDEPGLYMWCLRNMHSKMCSGCDRFKKNGPVISDYQREKQAGIVCYKCDKNAGHGSSGSPRLCFRCENKQ